MIDKNTELERLEAARQVLLGNLFIEEAMIQCNIKDKRTMVNWLKRAILVAAPESSGITVSGASAEAPLITVESRNKGADQLQLLVDKNKDLVRYQSLLNNRINELEALIAYAERKFKIKIRRMK
ncbi:hypothetical protein [Sphingobacterium ginsenosidimutans]|uniref:Transposase n=1 Tax=Sphingobacterium ginsenosidimutans TaxID=687845 RepID=A0ABP7ZQP4_9SPHI